MKYIFVTFSVFRYSRPVIVSSFVSFPKKLYNDVGVYVLKLLSKTMCTIVPFPNFVFIFSTVILSFTTTLLLGRVSPAYSLKVKVWVEDSYVAIYLELEASVCATMPVGRSNNMSNINGNRANLQNFAPPIVHTVDMRPIGLIVKLFHNLILYLLLIFICLLLSSLQEIQEV